MRAFKALSIGLSAIALVLSVGMTKQVHAAGAAIFIDQQSPIAEYGQWVVSLPGDATYRSSLKTKILNDLGAGTYSITVTNPTGSMTKMSLIRSGTVIQKVDGNTLTFDVTDDHTYRVNIEYVYTGTVQVQSDPSNVGFVMTNLADGSTYTGTTPATFNGMAPVGYRVQYDIEPACEVQKTLQRELIHGSTLTLFRDFTCGDRRIPTAGRTAEPIASQPVEQTPQRVNAHTDAPDKRIVQTASMSEVVPGGLIRFTITVKNVTRTTLHNVAVTDRYNPEMIDVVQPLLDGGVINGNLVEWNIPKIYAGKSWTTTFTARAKDHLVAGDRIVLMAHANSEESDFGMFPEAWSSVAGVGVAYLPQTGDRYDILLGIAAMVAAAFITNLTIRRKTLVELTA